jgi:hypothetical protein
VVVGHGDDVESPMAGGEIMVEGEGELAGGSGFGAMFDRDGSLVTPTGREIGKVTCQSNL